MNRDDEDEKQFARLCEIARQVQADRRRRVYEKINREIRETLARVPDETPPSQ